MEEKTLHEHLVAKTDGKAEPDNILIAGSIRITVIFPNLIRVECGSEKSFCDEATQSVWFRNHGKVDFTYEITKTKIIIKTEKAEFCITAETVRRYMPKSEIWSRAVITVRI